MDESAPVPVPLPHHTRLEADPSLRRRDRGRVLIGGSPLRVLRLTGAGAAMVTRWLQGSPVASSAGPTKLARRLVATGMMHPVPGVETDVDLGDVTVVIPVKDDTEGLVATLATLPTDVALIVVDDGSEPAVTRSLVEPAGTLLRRSVPGGPGVARQAALSHVSSPIVAFVDAGVELEPMSLERLSRWFADPTLVAVGPRVASRPGVGVVATYEEARSPLDLGPAPAAVGAGSPVTYLPTACLLARRDTIRSVGGFDDRLRWGEDVDLVWRLAERADVRFDPSVVVHHPARPTLRAFVNQRIGYGSAAGPLSVRHPGRLAPVQMSGWSLACWALAVVGRPGLGLALAAGTAVGLRRKLAKTVDDSTVEAAVLAVRGHLYAGRSLARASTRVWWPLTAVAWLLGARRSVGRLVAASLLDRWLSARGSGADRLLDGALGIVDDAAYGLGVWRGAIAERSTEPILLQLVEWPPRDEG